MIVGAGRLLDSKNGASSPSRANWRICASRVASVVSIAAATGSARDKAPPVAKANGTTNRIARHTDQLRAGHGWNLLAILLGFSSLPDPHASIAGGRDG